MFIFLFLLFNLFVARKVANKEKGKEFFIAKILLITIFLIIILFFVKNLFLKVESKEMDKKTFQECLDGLELIDLDSLENKIKFKETAFQAITKCFCNADLNVTNKKCFFFNFVLNNQKKGKIIEFLENLYKSGSLKEKIKNAEKPQNRELCIFVSKDEIFVKYIYPTIQTIESNCIYSWILTSDSTYFYYLEEKEEENLELTTQKELFEKKLEKIERYKFRPDKNYFFLDKAILEAIKMSSFYKFFSFNNIFCDIFFFCSQTEFEKQKKSIINLLKILYDKEEFFELNFGKKANLGKAVVKEIFVIEDEIFIEIEEKKNYIWRSEVKVNEITIKKMFSFQENDSSVVVIFYLEKKEN